MIVTAVLLSIILEYNATDLISLSVFLMTTFIAIQSSWFLYALIYGWISPNRILKNRSPTSYLPPRYSFTVLLPARHEEAVVSDTIKAISKIN